MKSKFFLLGISMCLLQHLSFAQNDFLKEPDTNRPLVFADMPAVMTVPVTELGKIATLAPGNAVTISTDRSFSFTGIVRSVTPQNDNKLLTVIIKLSGREGAYLTISAITGDDGTTTYIARALSFQHGDCFVLKKNGNNYSFIKRNFYDLVGE